MSTVPPTNQEAFILIYEIENSIRELIVETLSALDGPLWYKTRLPGDILKKYREGIATERSISWSRLIPHHPIYYIDFPHLREIITNGKNWDPTFKKLFIRREIFEGNFVELETIRNRLAHNRKLSISDITIARGVYAVFAECVGLERLRELSSRCTRKEDLETEISNLGYALEQTLNELQKMSSLTHLHVWRKVTSEWWFDGDYLGSSIAAITEFFMKSEEYYLLPRGRGMGHAIEKWLKHNNVENLYAKAENSLKAVQRVP